MPFSCMASMASADAAAEAPTEVSWAPMVPPVWPAGACGLGAALASLLLQATPAASAANVPVRRNFRRLVVALSASAVFVELDVSLIDSLAMVGSSALSLRRAPGELCRALVESRTGNPWR